VKSTPNSAKRYDPDGAVAMLQRLREVADEKRIDTLAVVCRAYLDSTPTAPRQHAGLARFFGQRKRP
jgi:hypothetical protein